MPSFAQEMNDFQKLGALNSHLKREDLSYQNKVLIIYQQILEEINEGCAKNQKIVDLEEKLDLSA